MSMKPPIDVPAAVIRNAVNQQRKVTQHIKGSYTKGDLSTGSTKYKPVKGSIMRKGK